MCIAVLNNEDLGEVETRAHRMEIQFLLTRAILTICLQFSAEARSAVTDAKIHKLEPVDSTLLKSLVNGDRKFCSLPRNKQRYNPLKG